MSLQRLERISQGKAKDVYHTENPDELIMVFRDDMTAFNGEKKEAFKGKGAVNHRISRFLMNYLEHAGIQTHYRRMINDTECVVSKLDMLPIEAVVRNYAAGGFAKRFAIPVGTQLKSPIYELFYKNDTLGDPMIRDEHALYFHWATAEELEKIKQLSWRINALLADLFFKQGMILLDFKLEFGKRGKELVVADEISPDSCRIWEQNTREILDKDRFRKDLGSVVEHYHKIARYLGV